MFRISCQFFCLDNDCFIYDKSFRGKTLKQLQSIESAAVCQLMCQRDPACVQFNYITEAFLKGAIHRKRCDLKGPKGQEGVTGDHEGIIAGARNCIGESILLFLELLQN